MSDHYYGPSWGGVGFLTGLVVGGVAALILATDDKGNTRPEVKNRLAIGKARAKAELAKVREVLNESWEGLNSTYLKAKHDLSIKLEQIKKNAGTIDKARYLQAVNEVMDGLKTSGSVTAAQMGNIKTFLVEDYSKLATAPEPSPKKPPAKKKA